MRPTSGGFTRTLAHDVEAGVARLLAAARDLPAGAPPTDAAALSAHGLHSHDELYGRYVAQLHWAVALAIPWWNAMVERRVERGETTAEAIRANYVLRPAGPAARPEVVWVVREHWLACASLNANVSPAHQVAPATFLLEWLRRSGQELPLAVLSGMPYWPIGLDEQGAYC